ncbi:putative endo beta- protein [Botrytis fragariae]|uniref:endo-1,3(4)-beta-glucanase n=1 Tax=Botrytis fragariae TaxID=1964551 RepID=A0A8H6ELR6_9HELO|nr:putative endo beta- protein [Botrytis fragariae]KAF5876585.1 putative endo beta- protein [Botrytis fragariae]
MATSSLFLRCLTISSFITSITAITGYQLEESYSGNTFFYAFDFFTAPDPTHGFVTYVSESAASQQGLISVRSDGVYMGVDSKTVLNPSGPGRNSVRIESKKSWTHGLFIADLGHMPGGACGSWPAMWTVGNNWPYNGEIDIIEGVNSQNHNLMSLHSGSTCSVAGSGQTGTLQSANCNNFANPVSVGCGISDTRTNSYGRGFNLNGGGIYAMEWTSSHIRVYFFPAGTAPTDINGPNPDPSKWGTPVSNFEGDCDIDTHFKENRLIFDTTFCGDWGSAVWSSDATCGSKAATCVDYVAGKPEAFDDQYWLVKSVKIYQLGNVASPIPSNAPSAAPAPSPSAIAPPVSPVGPQQSQNPPAPAVTPATPINTPVGQPPSQPIGNNNPIPEDDSILNHISDFVGNIGDLGDEGNCTPPPRPEPTYDPEYPNCGSGGKCPLTPAFTCIENPTNDLANLIPASPALPSVTPAFELLGIGSGGIPDFDLDINAENYLNAAKDELKGQLRGLAKQALAWTGDEDEDVALGTENPSRVIVAKPFYPDEAGNGNETAGSVASPTPGLSLGDKGNVVAFEGGAAEVVGGGLLVWGAMVVIGGVIMM